MRIVTADWEGFSIYVVNQILREKRSVRFTVDDVKVGAHSSVPSIHQHWWWAPGDNRAHPQFGKFFRRFVSVETYPEDGEVEEVLFSARYSGVIGFILRWWWIVRGLFVDRNEQEYLGWEGFEDYIRDELAKSPEHSREISVKGLSAATHTGDTKLTQSAWWSGVSKDAQQHLEHLSRKHVAVVPITTEQGEEVERVLFRLTEPTE